MIAKPTATLSLSTENGVTDFHKTTSQSVTIRDLLSDKTKYVIAYESGNEPIPL